jgi:hypothetical protein
MGVDYRVNYGIGVKLVNIDFNEDDEIDNMDEYLESIEMDGFRFFESGESFYSGGVNDYFIVIKNPFENGCIGLNEKIKNLKIFLANSGIKWEGDVDVVGGLLVN